MKTFKVTITYEVEIVDDPSDELTMLHIMDAVYQMQEHGTPFSGTTTVEPRMEFRAEEQTMSSEELEC